MDNFTFLAWAQSRASQLLSVLLTRTKQLIQRWLRVTKFHIKKSQRDSVSGWSEVWLNLYSFSDYVCSQKAPSCADVVWDRVTTARIKPYIDGSWEI
ncbi:hypothetical protein EMCRGX_G007523 [Ephydatia muelleri]